MFCAVMGTQMAGKLVPIHARHHHIGDNEIERVGCGLLVAFFRVICQHNGVPTALEHNLQHHLDAVVIIYNKKIFRGATGGAGEIGHMTINYEGPMDRSGVPGAIEAYLGQRFLSRHAKYRVRNEKESLIHGIAKKSKHGLTPKVLFDAAVEGDVHAIEILAWAGHKLGCVLGSCINLLDIRKVIVGGGVSAAGHFILDPARESLKRYVYPGLKDGIEIIRETLGNEVGMLGAAYLVFEYLDEHSFTS